MKKIVTRALAVAIAFTTMVSMSGIMTVNAEAATKKVSVNYTGKKTQKAKVKSLAVTVDGATVKAGKTKTVYLSGKNKVNLDTAVTVNVKGKKTTKAFKKNVNKVTYSSNNTKVATVSKKGVITIKKTGTAKITIKSKANAKKKITFTLKVKNGVKKMTIKKADTNITLEEGATYSFKPSVTTYKKVKKTITAKSSNKKVATVKVSGGKVVVTAKAAGKAEITVAPKYGSDKAKVVKVTVNAKKAPAPAPAPTPVVKTYKTKVVFADAAAKKVDLKGTISWDKQDGIAAAVKEFAAALGGNYTVKVNGKDTQVVNGKVDEADLAKIPTSGNKTDATVEASISIADALKLAGSVDAKATAKFTGSFKLDNVTVSNVSLANKVVTFKLGDLELKAFVEGTDLYLDGDQTALLTVYKEILGKNSLIKDFVKVEK
jgi:hypothetical protein